MTFSYLTLNICIFFHFQETVPIPPIFAEKILTICLPKVRNFIDVELNVLDEDIVEFHLHKYDVS